MSTSAVALDPTSAALSARTWARFAPVAAAALIAVVYTLDGYSYGRSNQMEQLAALLAYLEDGFLKRDYFIQFFVEGGPRYYYIRLLALGSHLLPLPALFFVLTWLANTATLLITFRTVRYAFGNLIAAYASLLLVAALYFYVRLGDAGFLLTNNLSPASLAIPGMFGAISAALRGSPTAMLWAAGTAVIHPLYGLAAAGSVLFLEVAQLLRQEARATPIRRELSQCALKALGFAALFALLWYRPTSAPRLDDATYFHIYARTRGPHHVLPSTFPSKDWILFADFTLCSLSSIYLVRSHLRRLAPLLWLAALVMLGFVVGYVFVELVPLRPVMVAQAYRFTSITSWVGVVVGAGAFGSVFEAGQSARAQRWRAAAVALVFTLLVLGERIVSPRARGVTLVMALLLGLGFWAVHVARRPRTAAWVMLAGLAAFAGSRFGIFAQRERWHGNRLPAFTLDDFETRYDDVAAYAREHTDRDAVFAITDVAKFWDSGTFRYKAGRALFVDHKVFPYGDPEIAEWYKRTSALKALDPQQNNDSRLAALAREYELDYAVLPKGSPTELPVAFVGEHYQLVALRPTTLGVTTSGRSPAQ